MSNKYLPTLYQQFIAKSRYSRYLPDEGRRETWEETVNRYFTFFEAHLKDKNEYKLSKELKKELEDAILNLEVMPSMRCLMTAGPALERDNISGYNCAYLPIDHSRAFDETLYILMNGTGVGFSVESKYTNKLPLINEHFEKSSTSIVVEDSKAGWARGLKELIAMLYAGQIPTWDLTKLRPAGARLKTFGGRSSGPDPLNDLFEFVVQKFTNAKGRRLSPIECHDIVCKIGDVVVVGGVRRSALISLSDLSDVGMQNAKSGRWWENEPQRALANDSTAYDAKPELLTFMDEWGSLIKSQSGERGIFNRQAASLQAAKNGRREPNDHWGTNPCCVPGDTLLLTDKGHLPIEDLVDKDINVWNGYEFSPVSPFYTGYRDTVIVTLSDGTFLRCTTNHKFILDTGVKIFAEDLKHNDKLAKYEMPILISGDTYETDAYSQGFYSGDGNTDLNHSWLYKPKYMCEGRLIGEIGPVHKTTDRKTWKHGPMLPKDFVPINGSQEYCLNWLAGLLDSDGVVLQHDNSNSFQIASTDFNKLDKVRLMLNRLGCKPKINIMHEERFADMPNHKGGLSSYLCSRVWRLLISSGDTTSLLTQGLKLERLKIVKSSPNRDARRFVRVVSIKDSDPCDTYCFEELKYHTGTFNGIVTGQSEIILRPNQFCNLTEVVVRATDTIENLKRKVKLATILGTFQSTLTDFKYLRKIWANNTEEERLLGVSLTGILDNVWLADKWATDYGFSKDHGDNDNLRGCIETLRQVAIDTNTKFAGILNIPVSTAITCIKPSGTVSQLVDSASGIHTRHSEYYIRTVRGDKKDPLTQFLIDQGIPYEDCVVKPADTVIFSFPMKSPEGSLTRSDITAIEHLELWKKYQDYWCEHKPSVTISVKPEEWLEVGAWVYKHFDSVSGVSFLPYSDHTYRQAPYQECTEIEYHKAMEKMPKEIDWSKLKDYEKEDFTEGSQELACSSAGGCEIR